MESAGNSEVSRIGILETLSDGLFTEIEYTRNCTNDKLVFGEPSGSVIIMVGSKWLGAIATSLRNSSHIRPAKLQARTVLQSVHLVSNHTASHFIYKIANETDASLTRISFIQFLRYIHALAG